MRPSVFSIPPHRAFADALAAGLIRRFARADDPLALSRGLVLVPGNRAKRAMADAFVRASGGGLLLPRLVAVGDAELDEALGPAFESTDGEPVPPAVAPLARRMALARLVVEEAAALGDPVDGTEAVRLAGELARTLDTMMVEEVPLAALGGLAMPEPLSVHWEMSLALFGRVAARWAAELAAGGSIEMAERRQRLYDRTAAAWTAQPPSGFVCVAGVTSAAPAVARLLRAVAELPQGMVVLPGLDLAMDPEDWQALGPPEEGPARGEETHPQYHLKLLLDRMGVARGEALAWRDGSEHDAAPARTRAIASAFLPAGATDRWTAMPAAERRLAGIRAVEVATPAEEAQAIAIAMRQALETPGRTAALVTPDRDLAARVGAHLRRWAIAVDDTAGRPLSQTPPGTLLLALADAAAQRFGPMPLLALLKHPLAMFGSGRLAWLEGARALDRALRGPRPAAGLAGVTRFLAEDGGRDGWLRKRAAAWWGEAAELLKDWEVAVQSFPGGRGGPSRSDGGPSDTAGAEYLTTAFGGPPPPPGEDLPTLLAALREAAQRIAGDAVWAGPSGRAASALLAELEAEAAAGPRCFDPAGLPALLRLLMDEVAVRPPQGGHPRLAILGLIEARLATADLLIAGGLNEGTWPGLPAPDPWLAPRVRAELGLPALERRIGIAAHDLAQALGAPEVLLTRSRRDAAAPAVASRFWLRLEALSGGLERDAELVRWARGLDHASAPRPAPRPAPAPPAGLRPRVISVTEVDRLKADPYAFYARRMLHLMPLDTVDADPSAAWRGTAVHDVLQRWFEEDDCHPERLRPRAIAMLEGEGTHPLLRALWRPRLLEAIDWIAREVSEREAAGRRVLAVEKRGEAEIAGVTLSGRLDRVDRLADGRLAIVDYKTGQPPTAKAVRAGFSLQLGLLGLIAERGGFPGIAGEAGAFEYWTMAKRGGTLGFVATPSDDAGKQGRIPTAEFTAVAADNFSKAAARWLTGDEPFTAKLHPEYAPYADYDQLMRRDEWYGREGA